MSRRQPKRLAALTVELSFHTVFDNEEERASDESEWLEVLHIGSVMSMLKLMVGQKTVTINS